MATCWTPESSDSFDLLVRPLADPFGKAPQEARRRAGPQVCSSQASPLSAPNFFSNLHNPLKLGPLFVHAQDVAFLGAGKPALRTE
jgi:hypothetical protein